jgi:hypothetical protein
MRKLKLHLVVPKESTGKCRDWRKCCVSTHSDPPFLVAFYLYGVYRILFFFISDNITDFGKDIVSNEIIFKLITLRWLAGCGVTWVTASR